MYVYNSRSKRTLRLNELMENIRGIAKIELISLGLFQSNNTYALKWNPINTDLKGDPPSDKIYEIKPLDNF